MPHSEDLQNAFGSAQPDHFEWQTKAPGVAEHERALVQAAFTPFGTKILDIGCGEGATLFHLGGPEGATGLDLFEPKLEFARSVLPQCQFVVGSAEALPFEPESFDHVLMRDVLHHLVAPEEAIEEAHRVLVPGGRLDVLEPCRNNPLVFAHALLNRVERGELRSTPQFLERLVGERFEVISVRTLQPLPLHRLAFHPDMGFPALGESGVARAVIGTVERIATSLVPKFARAYIHVRANKRP